MEIICLKKKRLMSMNNSGYNFFIVLSDAAIQKIGFHFILLYRLIFSSIAALHSAVPGSW